ncbi:hypothetical protein ACFWY9_40020 [Amycolatopsis sp. NPDC059027]|uniref:hypothetical protein n=1 Tax=unclassified Amycolatopsis TaxID=2618356 RepID=UPI00366B956D
MAMNGRDIYENFANAPGTTNLEAAKDELADIRIAYATLGQSFAQAAAGLEEHWQGDAAGAAARGAGPLVAAHDQASMKMQTADSLLDNQISSFHRTKNTVKPVPDVPRDPATFGDAGWGKQTGILFQTQLANDAAAHNVQLMNQWTRTSSHNGNSMPTDYGKIDPGAFSVSENKGTQSTINSVRGFDGTDHTRDKKRRPSGQKTDITGGRPTESQNTRDRNRQDTPPPQSTVDKPREAGRQPGIGPGDGTTPGSYQPPKPAPGGWPVQPPAAAYTPGGGANYVGPQPFGPGTPDSPGTGFGRRGGTGNEIGRGSGTGRGTGSGPGSGMGKALGEGKSVGGMRGGAAEPGMRGAGSTARGTTSMEPGVVQGGKGKGKGDEDKDHRRKYVVEDDVAFQLTDNEGEKAVDPRTGMPPTPPVLGQ